MARSSGPLSFCSPGMSSPDLTLFRVASPPFSEHPAQETAQTLTLSRILLSLLVH